MMLRDSATGEPSASKVLNADGLNDPGPAEIDNATFLSAIFGSDYERAHVTGFGDDPSGKASGTPHMQRKRSAHMWGGGRFGERAASFREDMNTYYCVSLFRAEPDGRARRRKALFDEMHIVVIDDVADKPGEGNSGKVEASFVLERLGPPSYRLETSPRNEQWGYILASPETSEPRAAALIQGMIAAGLTADGSDPGMKGVTRYVRLPIGSNRKAKYATSANPRGFRCRLRSWQPERSFTVPQIAAAFDIDLDAVAGRKVRQPVRVDDATDVWLRALNHLGLVKGSLNEPGKFDVTCPFVEEHTDAADDGTARMPNGMIWCHHGHCAERNHRQSEYHERLTELMHEAGDGALLQEWKLEAARADFDEYGRDQAAEIGLRIGDAFLQGQQPLIQDIEALAEIAFSGSTAAVEAGIGMADPIDLFPSEIEDLRARVAARVAELEADLRRREGRGSAYCEEDAGDNLLAASSATSPDAPLGRRTGITFGPDYVASPVQVRRQIVGPLARGEVTLLVGAPGVSKSALALLVAAAVAWERPDLVGEEHIDRCGNVLFISNEDDAAEVERRLQALARAHNLRWGDMRHRIRVQAGDRPVVLLSRGRAGTPEQTQAVDAIVDACRQDSRALVVIDTVASVMRGADENSADDAQALMSAITQIAREGDVAVLALHHTGKAAWRAGAAAAGDMASLRGSSAIAGAARAIVTLTPMPDEDGRRLGLEPEEAKKWSRLDTAKASYAARSGVPQWFRREGVSLNAIDERRPTELTVVSGLALRHMPAGPQSPKVDDAAILARIAEGVEDEFPFSREPNAGVRSVFAMLQDEFHMTVDRARAWVDGMQREGRVKRVHMKLPRKAGQNRNAVWCLLACGYGGPGGDLSYPAESGGGAGNDF
jgi:hypothetical protein